jgi:hypothetical protein
MNDLPDEVTWQQAVTKIQKVFKHEPFTKKCSDDNLNIKQRDTFRRYAVKLARSINFNQRTTIINIERLQAIRDEERAAVIATQISIQPGYIAPEPPTSQNSGFKPTSPYLQEPVHPPEIQSIRTAHIHIEPGTPIATPVPAEFMRPTQGPTGVAPGSSPELRPPGLVRRAANLAEAVAKMGGAFLTGQQVLCSEDELKTRQEICASCEQWQLNPRVNMHRCEACGCYQLKQHIKTEKCPLGKWPGDT